MNSDPSSYAIPLLVVVCLGVYYFNGTQSILNPTAQQSLNNSTFVRFFLYTAVILGVALVSIQTKSTGIFMAMIATISLVWFILGKSWQHIPG